MSKELDDLLRSAESTNFSLNTQSTEQTGSQGSPIQGLQQQPEDGGIFDLGDTIMAIPRGVVGAGKSAYGLIDALAMDALPDWENNPLGESKSVVGGLVEGISEFATGMFALSGAVGAIGKGVKGAEWLLNAGEMAKTGKTALSLQGRIIAGAATDFVAFDGNSGRLTDLVAKIPGLEEPVTQYLGFLTTNEEDGEILGRVKNTLEGAGVGAIVDGVIKSLKFLKEYRKHLADGKTLDESLKAADKVQPIVDLQKALKMSDDFVFAEASPFKGPLLDEALNSPEIKITINPDGTPSPVPSVKAESIEAVADGSVKGPAYVPLATRTAGGGSLTIPWSGPDLKSWVNLHGTLLGNPLTLIDIDKSTGEASIGILLRPDLVQDETVRKILKSVAEAPDMTPGELGAAADEIYRQGKRTQQEFGFAKTEGPAGAGEPPKPPAPGSAGPEGEDFGRSPNSGAQQPAGTRATPHQIFLSEGGWDTNQAEQVKQFFGGEFSEAVAERGRIIHNFNSAQPAQVFESGEVMAHPVKYTDAVNPRKLTAFERTGLAIQRLGINLGRMKDNDVDIASTVRVVHDMMLAMLKAEDPKFAGETMAGMWERVSRQLDIVNGKPTIEEQRQWLLRQAHAAGQNIDEAAAMAAASLEVSVGAVRDVVTTLADLFKRGPDVADWEWADLAERMGLANDAMQANKVISNSLARGLRLQNFKIEPSSVKRMTATQLRQDSKALNEVLLRHGGVDAIKDMAMKIYALGPDVDIRKVSVVLNKIEASFGSRTMRLMSDVHYASLLSSIRTHVTTLLSNTFTAMYLPFEEAVAGQFGRIMAKTPEEAKVFKAQVAEAFGTYSAMVAALPEAIEASKAAFKNPDGILSPKSSLFDISKRSRVPGMSAANLGVNNPQAAEFVDRLGSAMGVFTRALGASDEGFKNLAYRSVSRSKLLSMGVQAGKSGPELAKFVEESLDRLIYKGQALSQDQLMRRARDIVREKHGASGIQATEKALRIVSEWQKSDWYKELSPLAEFALARAEEGTFTAALRPGSLGNDFKAFLNRQPVLKFAVPFVQTPINIMLFAGQRIDAVSLARWNLETKVLPMVGRWTGNTKLIGRDGSAFAASRTRFLREMASGDPKLRAQAMGRVILGSSFAIMVGALGTQGLITGRGPSDPDQRKALSEAGWMPYAFKFGDTYVSYSRLDPFATILGTISDIQDATRYAPDDKQDDLNELGMGVLVALANNLTNKTYLQGMSNLIQAFSDPGARLERSAQAFVSSFMPNLLRDVGDTLNEAIEGDTAVKEIRSVTDAVLNKIPYFSETRLDPRRNALGEPIKKIQALGRDTLGALAAYPVPISARSSSDPLLQEMANLEYGFSNPSSQRNGYDMAEIMLPNNRSAHDRWLENSSKVRINGKTLRETLESLIKTPGYQALSNFNVSDQKSPRVEVVNSIIQRYRRAAFEQTMQEVPELRAAELNFRARKLAARSGIELR